MFHDRARPGAGQEELLLWLRSECSPAVLWRPLEETGLARTHRCPARPTEGVPSERTALRADSADGDFAKDVEGRVSVVI